MFSVKWVYRDQKDEAILVEEGYIVPLDKVVSLWACPHLGDSQIRQSVILREPSFGRLCDEALWVARRPICAD
jgi:hypothetical protein